MTKFQIAIRKLGVHFSKPIWSFIVNSVFWLFHLNKIFWVRNEMTLLKAWQLDPLMAVFTWHEDSFKDWTQWITTMVCSQFRGDCDDAAALAKWWFKEHGIKADILNLYNSSVGHTICVTRDRTKMVSNERVVDLNPATWESDVMKYFGNKYVVMI
jgi:hypothetical protein